MEQENDFVLVKRESVVQFIKKISRLSSMVLLLEYVCSQKKIEMTLTAAELCEVLKITPQQLDDCRKRQWIKGALLVRGIYVYRAYDVALLSERLKRRKMLRVINKVPGMPVN